VSAFLTPLDSRRIGSRRRRLLAPLVYQSDVLGREIVVEEGFEYDGASIPWWLPAAYVSLREPAEAASVIHDWLYRHPEVCTRAEADAVFREALEADGVGWWRRNFAWLGVRVGGGFHYRGAPAAPDPDQPLDKGA
jgi:hypothetical protein